MADDYQGPRPLAPRRSSSSHSTNISEVRRPKKVSTACAACQKAKRKCSGSYPCASCEASGAPCVFNEGLDQRRRLSARGRSEKSDNCRVLLDRLLETIRRADQDRLNQVIEVIRSPASSKDISACIEQCLANIKAEGSSSTSETASAAQDLADFRFESNRLESPTQTSPINNKKRVMTIGEMAPGSTSNASATSSFPNQT